MHGIWAIARHTLAHCLRMKMAGTLIVLLLLSLVVLPMVIQGDGTLAGRTRTLLAYGAGITALLLSIVTLLLSAGVIASDVRTKQVFTVATKPVSRWQYVLGRWLGVVVFDVLLLAVSAVAVYAFAQQLRRQEALNPMDRRTVETEVFVARRQIAPEPSDIATLFEQKRKQLQEENRYQEALDALRRTKTNGDEQEAREILEEQIRSDAASEAQSIGPGGHFRWRFHGIALAGTELRETGWVVSTDPQDGTLRISASRPFLGRLVYGGPVRVNAVDLRVMRLEKDFFEVRPTLDDRAGGRLTALIPGAFADIVADPTIQISFKASPAVAPSDKLLRSFWEIINPASGLRYMEFRTDPVETPATLTVSARLVDPNGQLEVGYSNLPDSAGRSTSVTILDRDVSVLYHSGGFEGNFLRAMGLVLLQLVFLAAVGVFAGSFLSFPVACLIGFATLPLSMARGFLSDSLRVNTHMPSALDTLTVVGAWAYRVVQVLLPDFAQTSPADWLVGGLNISWEYLGQAAVLTLLARAAPILAIACLIFHKRELARVQV